MAPQFPSTEDVQYILNRYEGEYEFRGMTFFGLPVFYFDGVPEDSDYAGIRWRLLYKEC